MQDSWVVVSAHEYGEQQREYLQAELDSLSAKFKALEAELDDCQEAYDLLREQNRQKRTQHCLEIDALQAELEARNERRCETCRHGIQHGSEDAKYVWCPFANLCAPNGFRDWQGFDEPVDTSEVVWEAKEA